MNRRYIILGVMFLLVVGMFLISCQPSAPKTEETNNVPALSTSDQKILEQYPDDLDNSVKELDEVG